MTLNRALTKAKSALLITILLNASFAVMLIQAPQTAEAVIAQKADFNGDGFGDLAIGVPRERIGTVGVAGGVNVIYGSASGLSATATPDQFWSQNSPEVEDSAEASEQFGAAIAAGDFNNDGFTDLAIGVPFEDIGTVGDAGAVNVIYGSSAGLRAMPAGDGTGRVDQFWHQNSPNIDDVAESNEQFGSALATGDFNNDGFSDLAIGAPLESQPTSATNAIRLGAVNVIYGSASGLSATSKPDQFWHQDSPLIEDNGEDGDGFGASLATGDFNNDGRLDLAVGVPFEDLTIATTIIQSAGAVNVIYGSGTGLSATGTPDQFWTQNSPDVNDDSENVDNFGSTLATGDFNNDGRSDLAVGVPGESVGSITNAGAVNVIYGAGAGLSATSTPDQFWHQDSPNIEDAAESGDKFASALATGDFNKDGRSDLAVGVFREDVGTASDAGAANVIYGSASGLSATAIADQLWHQNSPSVEDGAESGDRLGEAVVTGDFNNDGRSDLAIGVPSESIGTASDAGAVSVIYGAAGGLSATATADQFWHQNVQAVEDSNEASDSFGGSLAGEAGRRALPP